uniref:Putative polygalacturonase non-catalytic subunit n=1 Tax=Populus alba TaxID=43335 RepID=A0A4U5N7I0_POPAL|nr:putative polygalacturonase non-catalytic subunit [Populus alba]
MHILHPITLLLSLSFVSLLNVNYAAVGSGDSPNGESPFTPKASLVRYWNKEIHTVLPKSAFCSSAKLFCFPDLSPSLEKHDHDSHFAIYNNKNFTNYGTDRAGGADSFKELFDGDNIPVDSFRRYGRDAAGHGETFSNYAPESNVVDQSFNTYGAGATGGTGEFKGANGKAQKFSTYTENANAGPGQAFTSYGKNGNGAPNDFSGYGTGSNVIGSDFTNYGETANGANDTFKSYGFDGNVPQNNFMSYGDGGNAGVDSFATYREKSNVGDDSFQSYAKNSNAEKANFANYGKSFNEGTDKFSGYGNGAMGQQIGFKIYGVNTTFKDYANKKSVTFAGYTSASTADASMKVTSDSVVKNNKWIEPGKFFRESMLKKGSVMPMPDIRDKMPKRSFLPRSIISKLPFSTSKIDQLKEIFHASDNSSMERIILDALDECERSPSPGETKRCVGSAEDMIDFATSVLGRNVAVRTTDNVNGSKKNIMIGSIKGINGGRVTRSVSCHQSLYPYLLYYCHSVPKVRVYEADLLDPNSKATINHGVAICHLDTSSWSPTHGSFLALGSGPGRIEVCHWIFENDMTWTIAEA